MVINPIVGVYIPTVRIPIKRGMTIPNMATFDHGTHEGLEDDVPFQSGWFQVPAVGFSGEEFSHHVFLFDHHCGGSLRFFLNFHPKYKGTVCF